MTYKILILVTVAVSAVCALPTPDQSPYGPPVHQQEFQEPPQPYQFEYGVRDDYSGANYGHQEVFDGKIVTGSYQVALPDGRIQTVKYHVDPLLGYMADVTYEGVAQFQEHIPQQVAYQSAPVEQVIPVYKQVIPVYKPKTEEIYTK